MLKSLSIGCLDYAGITNRGQKVMGVATLDKDSSRLVLDSILQWSIPEDWNAEDAASVPYAYSAVSILKAYLICQ